MAMQSNTQGQKKTCMKDERFSDNSEGKFLCVGMAVLWNARLHVGRTLSVNFWSG